MSKWLLVIVTCILLITGGCYEPKPLTCPMRDIFCDGDPGGICVTAPDGVGYCAFPATDCPSMYRWAEFVDPSLEKTCVDPALVEQHNRQDAGTDAGSTDAASSG